MEGMEQQYGQRISNLEKEVHGLGTAIGALQAQGMATAQRVDKIGDAIDRMLDQRAAAPPLFTPPFVLSMIGGVVLAIGGLFLGGAQYVELAGSETQTRLQVLHDRFSQHEENQAEAMAGYEDFRTQTHYEVSKLHEFKEQYREQRAEDLAQSRHMDDLFHQVDNRLREVESRLSSAETGMRAIGDFVKDVDQHGSRHWVSSQSCPAE